MTVLWTATMWLEDVQPVDHVPLGLARLIRQYRGDQPRLQDGLDAFLFGLQSVEDVSMEVLVGRWPLTAVGVQLNNLGKIVGQERGEMLDTQYRLWILARILVNRGNGRAEELMHILDVLGAESIYYDEGTAEMRIDVTDMAEGDQVRDLMGEAKAGGVRLSFIWNEELDEDAFQFANTLTADDTDADTGFGDLTGATQTTGGYISGGG